MRRLLRRFVAVGVAVVGLTAVPPVAGAEETPAPAGYRIVVREFPAAGVEYLRLQREAEPLVVNLARVSPGAAARVRTILSNERVAGSPPLERTSDMCRRSGCLAAINGDFFSAGTGEPVGGLVTDGQLVRSPTGAEEQLNLDGHGRLTVGPMVWSGVVDGPGGARVGIDVVNRPRPRGRIALYTSAWARSTGTDVNGTELVLRVIGEPGQLPLGHPVTAEVVRLQTANAPLPEGTIVLSGTHSAAAGLRDLFWATQDAPPDSRQVVVRVDAEGSPAQSIGVAPVLLRGGARQPLPGSRDFVHNRHPRTLVANTADGTLLLVAVDGRQPGVSHGMTLGEAQGLLEAMGAVDAVNLDGGGSTTYVGHRVMLNRASDQLVHRPGRGHIVVSQPAPGDIVAAHLERPVANALEVVPA